MIDFASFQPRLINPARSRFNGCWLQRRLSREQTGSSSLGAHHVALSQGYSFDRSGAGDVAVMDRAALASPRSDLQGQLWADQTAIRACARGADPLADLEQIAAIPRRFVPQLAGQLTQAHIADSARQLVVSHESPHVVGLDAERLVFADQRPAQLVQGILARVGHAGVEASDPFLVFRRVGGLEEGLVTRKQRT